MRVATMTMCAENTTTTKRWVPFGLLDEFDVANTTSLVTWVLAMRGGRGGGIGRESWGSIAYTTHGGVRVTGFFSTTRCACLHA